MTQFVGSSATRTITTGTATSLTVTGLTNGQTPTFTVAAINGRGTGPPSQASSVVTVGAPAASTANASSGSTTATITWTAPANNGSAILSYSITTYIGGYVAGTTTAPASATSFTIPGLSVGVDYTFTVAAKNGVGTGPASHMTAAVDIGTPTAPNGPTATPGNSAIRLSWNPPASANGSPITGYVVTRYVNGVQVAQRAFNATTTTQTLGALINGQTYVFRGAAMNAVGTGIPSFPTTPVTAGTPVRPTGITAAKGATTTTAVVKWVAPSVTNGSPIIGYVVTPYLAGTAQATRTFASTATKETVGGLIGGKSYTFKVAATNGNGIGVQSFASNAIVPS